MKPASKPTQLRVMASDLQEFCVAAMLKCGMRREDAKITAEVLVTTDTWGTFSHGIKNLGSYMRRIREGGTDPLAVPEVSSEGPAWAMIDGHCAIGMVSSYKAMELAMRKAKSVGVGYAGVRNSTHFGAAGFYATMAVRHDMIGLAMSNVDPNMTVPGASGSVVGNNPMAYGVPAGKEPPIVLDIATSAVAAGKVFAALAAGQRIPEGWIVDDKGSPASDMNGYPVSVSLAPMAGYKGYGLALMVEALASVLTGAAITKDVVGWGNWSVPTDEGHAFIAIDIGAMMPLQTFKDRVDKMIRQIKESPKAVGAERIYLPGEMEWERRNEAVKRGIPLPPDVIASLKNLAAEVGLEPGSLFG